MLLVRLLAPLVRLLLVRLLLVRLLVPLGRLLLAVRLLGVLVRPLLAVTSNATCCCFLLEPKDKLLQGLLPIGTL